MNNPGHDPAIALSPEVLSRSARLRYVQPILERRPDSIWTRAEHARDKLCYALQQACEKEGFDALVIKSNSFEQPAWVKLEAWIPKHPEQSRAVTERGSAVVTIEAKEFHRYELEYSVELHDRGWSKTYRRLRAFDPTHAAELVRFLVVHGSRPRLEALQLRNTPMEFWKPVNKVDVLSTDWLGLASHVLLGLFILLIGIVVGLPGLPLLLVPSIVFALAWRVQRRPAWRVQRRPAVALASERPTGFRAGVVLGVVVVGLLPVAVMSALGLLLLMSGGVPFYLLYRLLRKRRAVVLSSGKPLAEPRMLSVADSWQAVVSGLGTEARQLRMRFLEVLRNPPMSGFQSRVETIWYWGLDGKVERKQIVLTLRRAILFCQIHEYGQELYVGWDVHLNHGQWIEKTVVTGIYKESGELTVVNTVESGWQQLTEYDVTDMNCLLEWTHTQLVRLVQRLMEERKIDQEVDFKILRGERQGLTRPEETGEGVQRAARRAARKLVRTG